MVDNHIFVDDEDDHFLSHYGILRKSGRYPWGSGEDEYVRSKDFLGMVADLKRQGLTETQIAESFSSKENPFSTTDLRATVSIARNQKRAADMAMAQRLKYDKGYSNGAIAERMGLAGESSVRALLEPSAKARTDQLQEMAEALKAEVDSKGFVDVGVGTERYTGSSRTQFDTALAMLKSEDYQVIKVQVDQLGTGNKTLIKTLCPPGKTEKEYYSELVQDPTKIKLMGIVANDEGKLPKEAPILNFDSKRLGVRYAEDGGTNADGVIYVRPGVKDIHLGGAQYAQVRVKVDDTHYLKGMAVYNDKLPDGVDLMFNTNKSDTGNKLDALKKVKDEPEDPFGSVTRPLLNADGTKRTSVMNIVNTEGDWGNWSKNLASQMLSKQQPTLAKEQLAKTYEKKKAELDEINALTNPAVKKQLLKSYSDDVDSSAVHLKAAAMPRQSTQVILPIDPKKIRETEVYAPNFKQGERVVLVRYPHGGTFEIPELVVNNNLPEGKRIVGSKAKDAIGIHPKVAERLSGADFDGDTVLVIPNDSGKIKSKPALQQLKGFDPKRDYSLPADAPRMSPKKKQTEMGKISNLITDMTIKGANDAEIARAVKHSMVVIDAEKHHLDYKRSAQDNGIAALKTKYQGAATNGATTLISRTSRDTRVDKRKQYNLSNRSIDPDTGAKIYNYTGEGYTKRTTLKDGSVRETWVPKKTLSKEGAEVDNAHRLIEGSVFDSAGNLVRSGGQPIERVYADHANKLKALANESRKEWLNTKPLRYSPSAKQAYAPEVARLNAALNVALKNAPQERQAQLVANALVKAKQDANPDMGNDELKKLKGKALIDARAKVGAGKTQVEISPREWEAIQAGAISNEKLEKILANSDIEKLKALATPREGTVMTSGKKQQAQSLLNSGRTPSEVAEILGIPVSTLRSSLAEEE